MNIKSINYDNINECLHVYEHESGLKAFVIPKKGYSKKYATFSTHYGSINNAFVVPGEENITNVPDGIAHFLEHKLFEQNYGNVMDKFSELGSFPNAYTSFNQTVYLFSCTDRFEENFKLLLDFVQNPYITDESVEREKGIIGQEIRMYEDDPGWRVFFNLLGALYKENPVRRDIAGSIESISKIDKNLLYKCYNTFYHPSNMVIIVVGDVDYKAVFEQIEKSILKKDKLPEIKRIFPKEDASINSSYTEQKLEVSIPLFQMGFKDTVSCFSGVDALEREMLINIILEMIAGRSSALYDRLYNEGLINSTFGTDYTIEENYAFSIFGGESKNPKKVSDIIVQEIENIKKEGLNKKHFERIIKSTKGKFLKQLNSVERISNIFISVYFKKVNLFDYFDIYDKITMEMAQRVFEEHFDSKKLALSVINPI